MKASNNVHDLPRCSACTARNKNFFCSFSTDTRSVFEQIKVANVYEKGSSIFIQGQPANGVFLLCSGSAKLATYSKDGKATILRVVRAGELLGVTSVIPGVPYDATAQAIEDCAVNFISRRDFIRFISENAEAAVNLVRQLSRNYNDACSQIRSLALSNSVAEKLARLLIGWTRENGNNNGRDKGNGNGRRQLSFEIQFTHEEIAAMIGTTRETVTRLLKDFRQQELISITGSELRIRDIGMLESMVGRYESAYEYAVL